MSQKYVVKLPEWLEHWWWRFAYLMPPPGAEVIRQYIEIAPDERFKEVTRGYLDAYLKKGVMPPAVIAPAILNMADDVVAGRDIVIKTGDYVAIQMYLKNPTK